MTRNFAKHFLLIAAFLFLAVASQAQSLLDSDSAFKTHANNSGRLWGYIFGDFYVKTHSDSLNRGGNNQYTGIPQNRNAFAFRRVYLGYDFNFNKTFSTELLLAAEDNFPAGNPPTTTASGASGDLTSNGKETFFIKLANVRWRNIFKGTDLVVGEQFTPSFALLTEKVWNYRSVERTISDIRRTPSYDMGAGLQGNYGKGTFGYDLLVANGSSDKPASTSFKWFYGDVWTALLDKKLILDVYADYQRLNWVPGWHHDRQMLKGFIAYSTSPITVGVEGFINNMRADTKAGKIGGGSDTLATKAEGIAFFVHGDIIKEKLRFFARVDLYNPNKNVNNSLYASYGGISSPGGYMSPGYKVSYAGSTTGAPVAVAATSTGDPTAKETFFTAGLDFMPYKDIHFEPNIWYEHYASQLASTGKEGDADVVLRMSFFFVFGKHYSKSYTQL